MPFVKEFQKTQWGMDWERTGLSQDLQKPITLGKYCFCVGNISMRITLKLSLWDVPWVECSGEILWRMNSSSNNEIVINYIICSHNNPVRFIVLASPSSEQGGLDFEWLSRIPNPHIPPE